MSHGRDRTRWYHPNMALPIRSLIPLNESDVVETRIHCFSAQEWAKKLKHHKVGGGKNEIKDLFLALASCDGIKNICYGVSRELEDFTNFRDYKEKFAAEKEVGYWWKDKVSCEQTRAEWNNNAVCTQSIRGFQIVWIWKSWH